MIAGAMCGTPAWPHMCCCAASCCWCAARTGTRGILCSEACWHPPGLSSTVQPQAAPGVAWTLHSLQVGARRHSAHVPGNVPAGVQLDHHALHHGHRISALPQLPRRLAAAHVRRRAGETDTGTAADTAHFTCTSPSFAAVSTRTSCQADQCSRLRCTKWQCSSYHLQQQGSVCRSWSHATWQAERQAPCQRCAARATRASATADRAAFSTRCSTSCCVAAQACCTATLLTHIEQQVPVPARMVLHNALACKLNCCSSS